MKKFTPLAKGLFTGIVMMLFSLAIYYFKLNRYTGIENLIYVIYAAGIIWALIEHSKMAQFTWKFKELFIQGFRCFIVVTLIMVIFTGIFSATHPEMAADNAIRYREYLIKEKNKTPAEIDEAVATGKKTIYNPAGFQINFRIFDNWLNLHFGRCRFYNAAKK